MLASYSPLRRPRRDVRHRHRIGLAFRPATFALVLVGAARESVVIMTALSIGPTEVREHCIHRYINPLTVAPLMPYCWMSKC